MWKRGLILLAALLFAKDVLADPLDEWTLRNPVPTPNSLRSVAWGNDIFIAVGDSGTVLTSSDGVSWTAQRSGTQDRLRAVTYGNGAFVAVGGESLATTCSATIVTSSDGHAWTRRNSTLSAPCLKGIAYGKGTFVAVGYGTVLTSADGISWTQRAAGVSAGLGLISVAFGNGSFASVVSGGAELP